MGSIESDLAAMTYQCTPEEATVEAARRAVCAAVPVADDAREVMSMLGLLPEPGQK